MTVNIEDRYTDYHDIYNRYLVVWIIREGQIRPNQWISHKVVRLDRFKTSSLYNDYVYNLDITLNTQKHTILHTDTNELEELLKEYGFYKVS